MSVFEFTDRITQLTARAKAESQTARLREYFPAIETALAQGVKLDAILAELRVEGFDFELTGFKSALYRIRKKANPAPRPAIGKQPQQALTATIKPTSIAGSNVHDDATRIKSAEQLKLENPLMAPIEINKLYAQQYEDGLPKLSKESIREIERKYGAKSQA